MFLFLLAAGRNPQIPGILAAQLFFLAQSSQELPRSPTGDAQGEGSCVPSPSVALSYPMNHRKASPPALICRWSASNIMSTLMAFCVSKIELVLSPIPSLKAGNLALCLVLQHGAVSGTYQELDRCLLNVKVAFPGKYSPLAQRLAKAPALSLMCPDRASSRLLSLGPG